MMGGGFRLRIGLAFGFSLGRFWFAMVVSIFALLVVLCLFGFGDFLDWCLRW